MGSFMTSLIGERVRHVAQQSVQSLKSKGINDSVLAQMSDLNTEGQLREGVKADGSIMPDYSPVSVEVYGKPPGPIKLFDTGDFYKSIDYSFAKKITVTFDSVKDDDNLIDIYGSAIIGLNDESREFIMPEIIENLKDEILRL